MCTAADMEEKIIDALYVSDEPLQTGDAVTVIMEEKMGQKAVIYGFFFPFIVLVAVLFLARALGSSEVTAALSGIGSLIPYYLVLYALRKKIEKSFIFTAEKKNKF
jgi:sigma-E factor negative regulatory protein RseC